MFEYQNEHYENRNQMYNYNGMPENGPAEPHKLSASPNPGHTGKKARILKKAGAITLSAILFGGVAAGSFQAVNYLTGYQTPAAESAAASAGNNTASLLQTASLPGTADGKGSLDVSDIAQAVMPSIVSITNKSVQEVQNYFSLFGYGYSGETIPQETESRGSGIIIGKNDTELLIVTNYHVIADADTLSVAFNDNQVYEANTKGTDPDNDLAVIAVPLESISADTMSQIAVASIGDSDSLKVGEQVVAIGNALGYGQSVTTGIVSATNRTLNSNRNTANTSEDSADQPAYIQTDAAINPGNSGGALLNSKGEVIGINEAKYADEKVEGVGYAIPISHAKDIIDDLKTRTTKVEVGEEEQGYLGIQIQNIDTSMAKLYGMPEGVYVYKITEDSAAANSELKEKDIITKFDGETVRNYADLTKLLTYYKEGTTVNLTVQRLENGEYVEKEIPITLNARPQEEETAEQPE